jgi:hypothetical protein
MEEETIVQFCKNLLNIKNFFIKDTKNNTANFDTWRRP